MRKFLGWLLVGVGVVLLILAISFLLEDQNLKIISPLTDSKEETLSIEPANKYAQLSFEALAKREFRPGEIKLGPVTKKEEKFSTCVFTYQSDGRTISGMANLPVGQGQSFDFTQDKFPVIILLRGWADRKYYHIGLGTEKTANYLAENGFLTLAPDFLGYGYSDWEDQDILLARFYRPVEVLNLIAAISSLPSANSNRIGLWGHSNGAQIALSILEITGKPYPTSLWAPVSLGFPESVLTYLGTQEEVGNVVKDKIEEFLRVNDPKKFSITEYFDKIEAPFIVHQATADELIKPLWTKNLVEKLKSLGLEVDYYQYSKENHNFNRHETTGDVLRKRDLEFFRKWLIGVGVGGEN